MRSQNYLQHYRRRANLSQTDLAKAIGDGVGRVIVSNWETGISSPTEWQKEKISDILGISLDGLFPEEIETPIQTIKINKV